MPAPLPPFETTSVIVVPPSPAIGGQQEPPDCGIINHRAGRYAVGIGEYGPGPGELWTPGRVAALVVTLEKFIRGALANFVPRHPCQIERAAASPAGILLRPVQVNVSRERSGNTGVILAEVKELGRLKIAGA